MIGLDFKYYEDASDAFQKHEGTLLPLWCFEFERARNLEITGLGWNPKYQDLFVASYGSCKNSYPSQYCIICNIVIIYKFRSPINNDLFYVFI